MNNDIVKKVMGVGALIGGALMYTPPHTWAFKIGALLVGICGGYGAISGGTTGMQPS